MEVVKNMKQDWIMISNMKLMNNHENYAGMMNMMRKRGNWRKMMDNY